MQLFTQMYALIGIAHRLPIVPAEGREQLHAAALTILEETRAAAVARQRGVMDIIDPVGSTTYAAQKLGGLVGEFRQWRDKGYPQGSPHQNEIIAIAALLSGDDVTA